MEAAMEMVDTEEAGVAAVLETPTENLATVVKVALQHQDGHTMEEVAQSGFHTPKSFSFMWLQKNSIQQLTCQHFPEASEMQA